MYIRIDTLPMKLKNKYYLIRHGRALSNEKKVISCWPENFKNFITKEGRQQIKKATEYFKDKDIDLIFSSDLLRTKQSAEIIGKKLKIKPLYDKRLREYNVGDLNGIPTPDLKSYFESIAQRFTKTPPHGENYRQMGKRIESFLKNMEKKYNGKNIVIVSHQVTLSMISAKLESLPEKEAIEKYFENRRMKNAEIREF